MTSIYRKKAFLLYYNVIVFAMHIIIPLRSENLKCKAKNKCFKILEHVHIVQNVAVLGIPIYIYNIILYIKYFNITLQRMLSI